VIVGLVGVVNAVFLGLVPVQVAPTAYSYPLAPGDFAFVQGFLALLALAVAGGMLGVRGSGAAPGRVGLAAAGCAATGFVLLGALDAARIAFAGERADSPVAGVLATATLAIQIATAVAVIALGCVVVVTRRWPGWRAWLPLATGVALLVVPLLGLLDRAAITRAATVVWLILTVVLGLTVYRAGHRALAAEGVQRVRRPGVITIAALLFWFNAASFGIPAIAALASVLGGRGLPRLFGFESFGGGPFERFGPGGLPVLLGLYIAVCLGEVVAGRLLWQNRRSGRILALVLLPVGALLWWGFAVPLPALNGLVRTALVIVGWRQKEQVSTGATPG
jgi:hypothetical protein